LEQIGYMYSCGDIVESSNPILPVADAKRLIAMNNAKILGNKVVFEKFKKELVDKYNLYEGS